LGFLFNFESVEKIKNLFYNLPAPFLNKYFITFIIFLIWVFFIDTFDIMTQIKMKKEFNQLKEQQEFYKSEIDKDSTKIFNLNNNPEDQERFARERFLMKKDNEDIFIVREKK
jgi:cell division protein FtsB